MDRKLGLVLLLCSASVIAVTARAADHSDIMPFVADDVVAIGFLDLTAIDMPGLLKEARDLGTVPPDQLGDVTSGMAKAQRWFNELVARGVPRAYILLRTSDVRDRGPTWVLPLADVADRDAVDRLTAELFDWSDRPAMLPRDYRIVNGAVLAAMNKTQLERLAATPRVNQPRPEVLAAVAKLGDGHAGMIVLGDADSRRVVREMFPALPAPFQSINGRMIADDLLWGGVAVDLPPHPKVTIHIETSGRAVAEVVEQSAVKALQLAQQLLKVQRTDTPSSPPVDAIRQTLALLELRSEGAGVTLTLGTSGEEVAQLRQLFAPQLAAARQQAQRNRRINQFKQLALAFVNHESAYGEFVEQASYDEAGRSLLSWRVHLLPYLEGEGAALYNEFHLDEPWDSPHNRTLIQRMPDVFSDPSAAVRRTAGVGRTTFVAPVEARTVFPPRKELPDARPLRIRDVTDGTSKTILFVEVAPEHAVVWSKPEDWNVNLDDPRAGVKRTDRPGFVAAFCDGHVRYIANDFDARMLAAMLTRAGKDRVD